MSRRGWTWPVWIVKEALAWSAVLGLVFAIPEGVYRWQLEPQLTEVRQLRQRLEGEVRQLRAEDWEQWAGEAMERMRQEVRVAVALVEEKGRDKGIVANGLRRTVRLRPDRTTRPVEKSTPSVKGTPSANSTSPGKSPPSASNSSPRKKTSPGDNALSADSASPESKTSPGRHAPSGDSEPPARWKKNVLLRVPGVGPEDVVWTAIDAFYHAPYEFGGEDDLGVDCSALVQQVFSRLDVELPRTAQRQFDSRIGVYVGLEDVRPGDLLFFHTRPHPYIGHVGIYAGNGAFLHAPRTGKRVEFQALNGFYRKRFVAAKRILGGADGSMASLPVGRQGRSFR